MLQLGRTEVRQTAYNILSLFNWTEFEFFRFLKCLELERKCSSLNGNGITAICRM